MSRPSRVADISQPGVSSDCASSHGSTNSIEVLKSSRKNRRLWKFALHAMKKVASHPESLSVPPVSPSSPAISTSSFPVGFSEHRHQADDPSSTALIVTPIQTKFASGMSVLPALQPVQVIANLPPETNGTNDLVAIDDSLLDLLADITRGRHGLVEARAGIARQQNDIASQLSHDRTVYKDLLNALGKSMPEILASGIGTTTRNLLLDNWTQFESLTRTLEEWQQKVEQDKNDLLKLEAGLVVKEEALYQRLRTLRRGSIRGATNTISESHAPSSELHASYHAYSSSSCEDLDEEKYYQAIGDINLLRDRLFNLESSFVQEQLRNDPSGKGTSQGFIKSQLLEEYMEKRQEIIQAYFEAKHVMEESAKRCLEKRITVEAPNLPPNLDQIFTKDRNVFSDLDKMSVAASESKGNLVEQWLRGVREPSHPSAVDPVESQVAAPFAPLDQVTGLDPELPISVSRSPVLHEGAIFNGDSKSQLDLHEADTGAVGPTPNGEIGRAISGNGGITPVV